MFYSKVSFCYIIIHTDYYIQYCEASIATIDCSLFSRAEGHRLATWRALTYCLSWLCSGKITQICLKKKCKNITYIQVFVCVCVLNVPSRLLLLLLLLPVFLWCPGVPHYSLVTGHLLLLLLIPAADGQTPGDDIPGSVEGHRCLYKPENLIKKPLSFHAELRVN